MREFFEAPDRQSPFMAGFPDTVFADLFEPTIVRSEHDAYAAADRPEVPIVPGDGRHIKPEAMPDEPAGVQDRPEQTDISRVAVPPMVNATNEQPQPAETPGEYPPEQPSTYFELPDNITELVRTALSPSGIREFGDTSFFSLRGHPDLIVRLGNNYTPEELPVALQAANELTGHGVHVLPSHIVPHDDELYVVTQRVEGIALDEALAAGLAEDPGVFKQIDTTWKGLSDRVAECLRTGGPIPLDITDAFQYMYGATAADAIDRVRLVDLPVRYFAEGDADGYEQILLDIANEIALIERHTGSRLEAAQTSVRRALELCRDSEEFGDGMPHAIRHVLEHHEIIRPTEPRIHDFRTR